MTRRPSQKFIKKYKEFTFRKKLTQKSINGFSPKKCNKFTKQFTVKCESVQCVVHKTAWIISKANAFQWLTKVTNRQFSYTSKSIQRLGKKSHLVSFSNNISRTISLLLTHGGDSSEWGKQKLLQKSLGDWQKMQYFQEDKKKKTRSRVLSPVLGFGFGTTSYILQTSPEPLLLKLRSWGP